MIKDLRRKFVLTNMLLVFVVLLCVFSSLCVAAYQREVAQSQDVLIEMLHRNGKPPRFSMGGGPYGRMYRAPSFMMTYEEGAEPEILYSEGIDVSAEGLATLAQSLRDDPRSEGLLRMYNVRFLKKDWQTAALIEISGERSAIRSTVVMSLLGLLASMAALFAVSVYLSRQVFLPAEEAWAEQRRFVADASHELKTPLTVILANTAILKAEREKTAGELGKWISNTEDEALRMKQLVESLLFLARSDSAKAPKRMKLVSLSDVAQSSALSFESVAYDRSIAIETDIAGGVNVPGDEMELARLADILLDNAVKYSPDGGHVSVRLSAYHEKASLSVENNGALLSASDISHLFDRFYRADKARSHDGYGLGLSIAKSIAESHSGQISASLFGSAVVFTVSLPLGESEQGKKSA
jgi:signal transduction histidine kinase